MKLIFGYGRVGQSLAQYFRWKSDSVLCLDEHSEGVLEINGESSSRQTNAPSFEDWVKTYGSKKAFDAVFLSPGVDARRAFLKPYQSIEKRELDLFLESFPGKVLAITGTNGKSSFVHNLGLCLQEILGEASVFVGGNLGRPLMEACMEKKVAAWAVVELSSYQLERLRSSFLDYGVLLNLSPDHLDRYTRLEEYYETKLKLLELAKTKFASSSVLEKMPSKPDDLISFSDECSPLEQLNFVLEAICARENLPFKRVEKWECLPHRQQLVCRAPAAWVNDSKSTNLHSCQYALRSLQKPFRAIALLVGGRDKGENFLSLREQLRDSDEVWGFGESSKKRAEELSIPSGRVFGSLADLLNSKLFMESSSRYDCILLSPGGSSFDEFKNFEERGDFFSTFAQRMAKL